MTNETRAIRELAEQWKSSGIEAGDTVMFHSSARRTMQRLSARLPDATPTHLLESLLRALDVPRGTLLLPLFNFGFPDGIPFDIRHTPSQMGALTEAGRLHPRAVRTGHPIYSFAVLGRHKDHFQGLMNFSGYGSDSPFALLRDLDGKIASLDLSDQKSMTMYHHVEEMHQVPYRFHKTFTGPYTDFDGTTRETTFGLFVRNTEMGVKTHVNPMGEILWEQGLYRGDRPGEGSGLRVIRARAFYEAVGQVIREGRAEGLLYRIEERGEDARDNSSS